MIPRCSFRKSPGAPDYAVIIADVEASVHVVVAVDDVVVAPDIVVATALSPAQIKASFPVLSAAIVVI